MDFTAFVGTLDCNTRAGNTITGHAIEASQVRMSLKNCFSDACGSVGIIIGGLVINDLDSRSILGHPILEAIGALLGIQRGQGAVQNGDLALAIQDLG
jgi:hypothetical protein